MAPTARDEETKEIWGIVIVQSKLGLSFSCERVSRRGSMLDPIRGQDRSESFSMNRKLVDASYSHSVSEIAEIQRAGKTSIRLLLIVAES